MVGSIERPLTIFGFAVMLVQRLPGVCFKLGYKPVATALDGGGAGDDDVSDDLSDHDDEENSDSSNDGDTGHRHHHYVPFVRLFPKMPPSASAITGMKQRYHYHPPEAVHDGDVDGDSEGNVKGVVVSGTTTRDGRSGQERSVSFAGANRGASSSSGSDGIAADADADVDISYLQGIVDQMMGMSRRAGARGNGPARKKAGFAFNPNASREAGLKRYCDYLRGDGVDYSKVYDVDQERCMSSSPTTTSSSGSGSGTTVETKSALKRT